jgi:hypothetical protein
MYIETIHFDRVFDVQSGNFSFEAGGKRQFGVVFDHEVVPRVGDTYAVALDAQGNWQKVVGWRDLATATVGLKRSAWAVASDLFFDIYILGLIFPAAALVFSGIWTALLTVVVMVLAAGAIVRGAVLHNRKVVRALRAVPPSVPPGPPDVTPVSRRARIVAGLTSLFN